jgi:hypothetical protein
VKGRSHFTEAEANNIRRLLISWSLPGSRDAKRVRHQLRKLHYYVSDYNVSLSVPEFERLIADQQIYVVNNSQPATADYIATARPIATASKRPLESDESYIIDLCDELLGHSANRQHRFDFLRCDVRPGSARAQGIALPVDAYYPALALVVEYRERQHIESVAFFDKPERLTASGVHRGEQRRLYDERRRTLLPRHGLTLIEFSYNDFPHDRHKRLVRMAINDRQLIRSRLHLWIR